MDRTGEFQIRPFSVSRQIGSDFVELGRRKHNVTALVEFDVTTARQAIRDYRRRTGQGLSLLAWMAKCIGQAVSEHREINAYRHGKRRLVQFDDVDIAVAIERTVEGARTPVPYVLRKADAKNLAEIHEEIETARTEELTGRYRVLGEARNPWIARAYLLPEFLRRLVWSKLAQNAFYLKRTMGTVAITSLGMYGKLSGWGIPTSVHTLCFLLGGIVKKPGVVTDRIEVRQYLTMTILFDHDIVDGAPAARFLARLADLVEKGYGLGEGEGPVTPRSPQIASRPGRRASERRRDLD